MMLPVPDSRLLRDDRAATGAEFALLVALFTLMLFGIIDAGRFAWTMNEAQKAGQAAVRHAVVTDFVPNGLDDFNFTDAGYGGGNAVPAGAVPIITCDDSTCSPGSFSIGGKTVTITRDPRAFAAILDRAQRSFPALQAANLQLLYRHIGLGFAGDPNGSDIAPQVTARIRNIVFQPMILLGLSITLPDVDASMTMEDGQGAESYSA